MKTILLQVQDDYLEEFIKMLPSDKVRLVDQNFLDTQKLFHTELENFKNNESAYFPYHEDMKKIDAWINEGGKA